ncbi:serine O-acetyltransferase [Shouchella clausii]|uniref:serine O-acetyltransferase n=1 Tax=Shouchella clausii TaxID=79880 RepID=UPI000BA58C14|nr:hypothetical protein [Shouchella clausii]MBX0319606.1 hypothetical protein [Shouchella clausii]MCZ1182573.1 hypothetical protein [Shouchella clausii]MDO7283911.1 hypothetical protein [Shouchella clausii]MDO7304007.1 hypothetical protein [Shouchella clausii]PAF09770.1 hypothetical protein CHH65_08945 [Shouchella clausii]
MIKRLYFGLFFSPQRSIELYKLSSWLLKKKFRRLAYIIKGVNITLNGCEIAPSAKIGKNFHIAHSVGIVIGEGVVIGDNVKIYQNVTLGTKDGKAPSYPTIKDNVILFTGAVVAGDVIIGENSIVGANSVVLKSVPPRHIATGVPAKVKKI